MKPGHLLVTGLVASLAATAARAAVFPFAEYHRPALEHDRLGTGAIYRRTDASSANYAMTVETNSTLAGNGWTAAPDSPDSPKILVESDGFGPGVDKVTMTINTGGAVKFFARLRVDGL